MNRPYHSKIDNEFKEVDRFLQNSGNNTDFWRLTNSPSYPNRHLRFPANGETHNFITSNSIYSDRHSASPSRSVLYQENLVCFLNFLMKILEGTVSKNKL